jgi:hypothetical protein
MTTFELMVLVSVICKGGVDVNVGVKVYVNVKVGVKVYVFVTGGEFVSVSCGDCVSVWVIVYV